MIRHPAENGIPQLTAGLAQLVPKGVKGVTLLGHVRMKPVVPESVSHDAGHLEWIHRVPVVRE
jgi:hypothetical protein